MRDNITRYLAIVQWARKRYTANNRLVISTGGNPSPYSRIENLAAMRLLGARDHWQC